jgi:hypothetical protein
VAAVPSGTGTPRVAMLSLTVAGTPSSGRASPRRQRVSLSRAAASAASASSAQVACSTGSQRSTCASTARTASTGEASPRP